MLLSTIREGLSTFIFDLTMNRLALQTRAKIIGCLDTKLVPSFTAGRRDAEYAQLFIKDLAGRLARAVDPNADTRRIKEMVIAQEIERIQGIDNLPDDLVDGLIAWIRDLVRRL